MVSTGTVVVVGAGAAGLMAAIHAADGGARVEIVESTPDGGRKILISGGGRCNVLPERLSPERFVTDSPRHHLAHLLKSWRLAEQRAWFEELLGAPLSLEPASGKYFPASNRARDVRDALVGRARAAGVALGFSTRVTGLAPAAGGTWRVDAAGASPRIANAVVVATGGLSVPSTGSEGAGLRWAETLGHRVHPVYPALTPLVAANAPHARLAGVSLDVVIRAPQPRKTVESRGGFLFTHRGYSGPAVLDISHLAVRAARRQELQPLLVSWSGRDDTEWEKDLHPGPGLVLSRVRALLPTRLAEFLLAENGIAPDRPLSTLPRESRRALVASLCRYPLPWTGDEGYRKAEVTGGGVALDEVNRHTLESVRQPGLFFCGEVLDAFGPIGGYNFAWAWATGRLAGTSAAASARAAVA